MEFILVTSSNPEQQSLAENMCVFLANLNLSVEEFKFVYSICSSSVHCA